MRNQFTFYKSFDDVIEDLSDAQIAIYIKTMLDVQFLRIKIEDVSFKDKILQIVWKAQKYSIETSIKGYLDSQKRENVKNPYLGIYDQSSSPYDGVVQQEQVKEEVQGKEEGKEEEQNVKSTIELNPLINEDSFNEWVLFKKIKVKGTITKLINFLIKYDKETQKQIIDNSIMNNYKGLFPPKNEPIKQPIKPKEKTLDEVLNIYIHQRKIHTSQEYTLAKCKEMLHWNLHKDFTKLSTNFEQEMMLAYGHDWVNGKIDFTTDKNIIEIGVN